MIEILLVTAIISIAMLAVVLTIALRVISRVARPEVRARARSGVYGLTAAALVAAVGWGPLMVKQSSSAGEAALAYYCQGAFEKIYRTVDGVEGVLVRLPPSFVMHGSFYHADDYLGQTWTRPAGERYTFAEFENFGQDQKIRYEDSTGLNEQHEPGQPVRARYAMTWNSLTTIPEWNLGVYGDETVIYDRVTREILARRVIYYWDDRSKQKYGKNSFTLCPGVDLGVNYNYLDERVRDSYGFVSRVLKPPQPPNEGDVAIYDLEGE